MEKQEKQKVTCDISSKPILTEDEACIFLGMCRKTLYELRIEGKIGFCKEKKGIDKNGKEKKKLTIRYRREHLLDYINRNYDEVRPLKLKYQ